MKTQRNYSYVGLLYEVVSLILLLRYQGFIQCGSGISPLQCKLCLMFKLTLRGLSLFFKILPISNTGVSIAYIFATVHFLYPKLGSFSDMEYFFYQLACRNSKVPKRFVGLNQMQCSPSFDWNWGKQNDPTACWHQLHPQFRVLQQKKCLSYPPECVGGVTETPDCVGREGTQPPSNPPLKFPPILVI